MAFDDKKNIGPDLHNPSFYSELLNGGHAVRGTFQDAISTNLASTSSFKYSTNQGLISTQEIPTDFSKFENHTFFNSAEANVNVAFEKIINKFPFDGTRKEYEYFFETLSGFEKYVYDQFPKNVGFLMFSGTQVGEDTNGTKGTYLSSSGIAGSTFGGLSKNNSGLSIFDPGTNSFTFEMQLFVPQQSNDVQTICQLLSGTNYGTSLFLSASTSSTIASLYFFMGSGSNYLLTSASINKGTFNHICATYNRISSYNKLQLFNKEQLLAESGQYNFGPLNLNNTFFTIGSGTQINADKNYLPKQTLSGAIDDFRYFSDIRTLEKQKLFARKSIFTEPSLKLYYKFNEPTGTIGSSETDKFNSLVLDSSGKSLHAYIANYTSALRNTSSLGNPLLFENVSLSPVLFPAYNGVISLNQNLLVTASDYDSQNPNLITKLVPPHYFVEGQAYEGLDTETGSIGNTYGVGSYLPGTGKMGTAQLLASFLYVWAKHFDELKVHIDAFSKLKYVDYTTNHDSVPDKFLPQLAKWNGFELPSFFSDATLEQFVDAENITNEISTNQYSLKYIQNQILRRILTNLREFITSKGTIYAIKSFLRAFGINPDNSLRIREFGGPTNRNLEYSRETRLDIGTMLSMSAGSVIISPFLSASRTEIGFPGIAGSFTQQSIYPPHGISNNFSDGLLTSGSWTFEAIYKYPINTQRNSVTQSLARICVTGSSATANSGSAGVLFNLVALSSSNPFTASSLFLYGRPGAAGAASDAPVLSIGFANINIFDGNKWNISFGRNRNDKIKSNFSSSYFLRAARQSAGEIQQTYVTQSYFLECTSSAWNALQNLLTQSSAGSGFNTYVLNLNASGSFIMIGSASINAGTNLNNFQFLNNTNVVTESNALATMFDGYVSQIRFWSKGLSQLEWEEHVKNYKSIGVEQPSSNFNFVTIVSGSFEKLRLDANTMQSQSFTDGNGNIQIFDYSQNQFHFSGKNFPTNTKVIMPEFYHSSHLAPNFDEATTTNKVRIRGFQDYNNLRAAPWAGISPVTRIEPSETPMDDVRLSIELSMIDALNRDIINIFGTLDSLNNVLGNPELMFSNDYPNLSYLRYVYFNRLTDKINLKAFFDFFKWFDTTVGVFIEQLIPKKTKFFGINYVIESHMLERAKVEYYNNTMYLNENEKPNIKAPGSIFIPIAGPIKKI